MDMNIKRSDQMFYQAIIITTFRHQHGLGTVKTYWGCRVYLLKKSMTLLKLVIIKKKKKTYKIE